MSGNSIRILGNLVVGKIDPNEFWPTESCGDERAIWQENAASVKNPKPVDRIGNYASDADEVVLVVCARGRVSRAVDLTTWRIVPFHTLIWLSLFRLRQVTRQCFCYSAVITVFVSSQAGN